MCYLGGGAETWVAFITDRNIWWDPVLTIQTC
jgi:hypothetical protein